MKVVNALPSERGVTAPIIVHPLAPDPEKEPLLATVTVAFSTPREKEATWPVNVPANVETEGVADACEIDRSYMGGIERGERNLALINIVRIVQALEMEPSAFFRGLDSDSRQELKAKREADQERRKLTAKFKKVVKNKRPADAL